jgi:hypothetical protein
MVIDMQFFTFIARRTGGGKSKNKVEIMNSSRQNVLASTIP